MKLLLDDIWHQCRDLDPGRDGDKAIQQALISLPKTLENTYHRCLKRNDVKDQELGYQILCYVCDTAIALFMPALQDALACDSATGKLTLPPKSATQVSRRGANVIVVDEDTFVVPAHRSIRQWIRGELNKPPKPRVKGFEPLELGEMCVKHRFVYLPGKVVQNDAHRLSTSVKTLAGLHPGSQDGFVTRTCGNEKSLPPASC